MPSQIPASLLRAAGALAASPGLGVAPAATMVHLRPSRATGHTASDDLTSTVIEATDGRAMIRIEIAEPLDQPVLFPKAHAARLEGKERAMIDGLELRDPFHLKRLPDPVGDAPGDVEFPDLEPMRPASSQRVAFTVHVDEITGLIGAFKKAGVKRLEVLLPAARGGAIGFRAVEPGHANAVVDGCLMPSALFGSGADDQDDGDAAPPAATAHEDAEGQSTMFDEDNAGADALPDAGGVLGLPAPGESSEDTGFGAGVAPSDTVILEGFSGVLLESGAHRVVCAGCLSDWHDADGNDTPEKPDEVAVVFALTPARASGFRDTGNFVSCRWCDWSIYVPDDALVAANDGHLPAPVPPKREPERSPLADWSSYEKDGAPGTFEPVCDQCDTLPRFVHLDRYEVTTITDARTDQGLPCVVCGTEWMPWPEEGPHRFTGWAKKANATNWHYYTIGSRACDGRRLPSFKGDVWMPSDSPASVEDGHADCKRCAKKLAELDDGQP